MFKAVIFDMDGILIDSEPFWMEAEIEIFGNLGITLTRELCEKMQGVKISDVVKIYRNQFSWENKTNEQLELEITEHVKNSIRTRGAKMKGVDAALAFFSSHHFSVALASSSSMDLITTVLDKLKLHEWFSVVHSSEFERAGKPEPDVFLGAAARLGVLPHECVVIEDSYNGLLAASRAGMKSIAVPASFVYNNPKFDIATIKLQSLELINNHILAHVYNA